MNDTPIHSRAIWSSVGDLQTRISRVLDVSESASRDEAFRLPLLPKRTPTSPSDHNDAPSSYSQISNSEDYVSSTATIGDEYGFATADDTIGEEDGLLSNRASQSLNTDRPTVEDRLSLRRVADKIPVSAFLVVFVEFAERFSFYGTVGPFVNFVQQPLPPGSRAGNVIPKGSDGTAGALGRGQQVSTAVMNLFNFWTYSMPIVGAIVADVKLGRFRTICLFAFICFVGHIILIVVALPSVIAQPERAFSGFILAIMVVGLGTGGIKANVSALVADQSQNTHMRIKRLPNGEKVIVDPNLTRQRIFMYIYMCINFGAFASLATVYAEKDVGFWMAFLIPTLVFTIVPAVLFIGSKYYIKIPPNGSIVMDAVRIVKMCCRGKWSVNPFELCRNFRTANFWDIAKPSSYQSDTDFENIDRPPWMTWDESFVLELSRAFQACKVLMFYPLYWVANSQCYSNLISQAAVMKTGGTPNDLINNLGALFLIILIPLFDRVIYPTLRKWGFNFTPLKRITAGFFLASIAMAHATTIQISIYQSSPCGKQAATCTIDGEFIKADVNVWHQAPTYLLMSLSEMLTAISGLEYSYSKGPQSMKSMIMSVYMLAGAMSSVLNLAIVPISKDPYLVWNYAGTGAVIFIAAIVFWITFRQLDKDEDVLNEVSMNTEHRTEA